MKASEKGRKRQRKESWERGNERKEEVIDGWKKKKRMGEKKSEIKTALNERMHV